MKENPFTKFIEMMREEGQIGHPSSILIGEVINTSPLKIDVEGLPLDKDDILVADYLVNGHKRQIIDNGVTKEITFIDSLKNGDLLALFPNESKQLYIVVSRVVSV